jgi:tetratricopeptide (TPR) repeat protein
MDPATLIIGAITALASILAIIDFINKWHQRRRQAKKKTAIGSMPHSERKQPVPERDPGSTMPETVEISGLKEIRASSLDTSAQPPDVNSRINILLVISNPLDPDLTPFNSQREFEQVYTALKLAEIPVAVIRLNPPTLISLQTVLLSRTFSILHFIGHGNEEGVWLETERGQADFVKSSELAEMIRQSELLLVLLNTDDSLAPAQALIDAGVRSVIAWKKTFEFSPGEVMAKILYSALAGGRTIAEAMEAAQRQTHRRGEEEYQNTSVALGRVTEKLIELPQTKLEPIVWVPSTLTYHDLDLNLIDQFVDRWRELTGPIYGFLTNPKCRAVALVGLGGIGKSSLAVAAAWRYGWLFPDGIICISAHENPKLDVYEILRTLELKMGWPIRGVEEVALNMLSKNKILLILDELDVVEEELRRGIAIFLSHWDTSLGGRTLVTTRENLPEFESIVRDAIVDIESIDQTSSIELLSRLTQGRQLLGIRSHNDFEKVAMSSHGHPLLIELTAGLLREGASWNEAQRSLSEGYSGPYEKIKQMLAILISSLSERHATIPYLLKTWSVFVAGASSEAWEHVTTPYLISLPTSQSQIEDGLRFLRRGSIFKRDEQGRYAAHPMVSQYLRTNIWNLLSPLERDKVQKSHLIYFAEFSGKATNPANRNLNLLDPEYLNLAAAIKAAFNFEDWESVKLLANNLYKFFDVRGYWDDWESLCKMLLHAGNLTADMEHEALAHYYYAQLCEKRGQYDEAVSLLEQAEEKAKLTDAEKLLARIMGIKGRVLCMQGSNEKAKQYYEESIENLMISGDFARAASMTRDRARLAFNELDLISLRKFAPESYRLEKDVLVGIRSWAVADAEVKLGELELLEGNLETAREFFLKALPILRDTDKNLQVLAELMEAMGILESKQDNLSVAREHFSEALNIAKGLGDRIRVKAIERDLQSYSLT